MVLTIQTTESLPYRTVPYSTVQYSTVQYSTVLYCTVQYSTVQYSTVQYSTILWTVHIYIYLFLTTGILGKKKGQLSPTAKKKQ